MSSKPRLPELMKLVRSHILIIIFIFVVVLFILIIFFRNSGNNFGISPSPYPTINEDQSGNTITTNPAASSNIEVLNPRSGDGVKTGFVVNGNARTFENTVNIRLSDSNGTILNETFTTSNTPDIGRYGSFEKEIEFESNDKKGVLEVFQISAKDGSETDKIIIPLIFIN